MSHVNHEVYREENWLTDYELHEMYDEMLDDVYGMVEIAGFHPGYATSSILKDVDPVAYRCGFNDWLDSELTDNNLYQDAKTGEIYSSDDLVEEKVA